MKKRKTFNGRKSDIIKAKRIAFLLIRVESSLGVKVNYTESLEDLENDSEISLVLMGKSLCESVVSGFYKKSESKGIVILAPSLNSKVEECSIFKEEDLCGWFERGSKEDERKEGYGQVLKDFLKKLGIMGKK